MKLVFHHVVISSKSCVDSLQKNSIASGNPEDHSDYNRIQDNTFGPGITAENIDLKEFTKGGILVNNTFNGSDIAGVNGAIAWVAIKGNNYTVANNTGFGALEGGQGFRVLQIHPGLAQDNKVLNNTCDDFAGASYCVFVDPRARMTQVDCNNKRNDSSLLPEPTGIIKQVKAFKPMDNVVCNCDSETFCAKRSSNTTMVLRSAIVSNEATPSVPSKPFYTKSWEVPHMFMGDEDEFRPYWD